VSTEKRARRLKRQLSLRGAIVTLSVGVLLPVLLSTTVGIVALASGTSTKELLIGVLMVCFTSASAGGAVIAVVLLGRRARLARLQSDLLANVSHELRTPLAAIRMFAQTLQSGLLESDPEQTRQSLATIVRETEWLEATIERVLTWKALAKDRTALSRRPAALGIAVSAAVERFERMVPPGDVELVSNVNSDLVVDHDHDAIARVVLNLLVNAYKYSEQGRRRISVDVCEAGGLAEIRVADNGIGIPADELKRVFDPFYRIESREGARPVGAGLGLAIVRHLVESHGGEVVVTSEVGHGSTFTVRLPLAGEPR
jgi:two-component system, OmpR family, phosphate regulon sensor histidine kinase PhoR